MAANKVRELWGAGKAQGRVLSKSGRYKEGNRAQRVPRGMRTISGSVVMGARGMRTRIQMGYHQHNEELGKGSEWRMDVLRNRGPEASDGAEDNVNFFWGEMKA